MWYQESGQGLTIRVQVQPRASRQRVGPVHDERLKVSVHAPAVDGAANEAVVALIAKTFGLPRRAVTVVQGHRSRRKTLHLAGAMAAQLDEVDIS